MKGKKRGNKTDEFEVEDIVAHKREGGVDLFKVRWKGFLEIDDTWEIEANLVGAPLFHSAMQKLKQHTEDDTEGDDDYLSETNAHKRRRAIQTPADPSRPCGGGASTGDDDDNCEYRIYATGTKVPKTHLPDEVALGNRLNIMRFKRTGSDGRGGDENGEEVGHDITVTYVIDGQHAYTIPFNAARRYCCQSLLSYLVRRTTFRAPRPSPDATAAASSVVITGSQAEDGGACGGGVAAPRECAAPKLDPMAVLPSLDGAENAVAGVACSSSNGSTTAVMGSGKGSLYCHETQERNENDSVANGSKQRAPVSSEPRLVAAA